MLRPLVLSALFLSLAAATFDNVVVSSAAYPARYFFAGLLVFLTVRGAERASPLHDLPGPAQLLLRGSWLLVIVAWLSTAWSVAPQETALQAGVYTLLVTNLHVHACWRWQDSAAVVADFRVIFWSLALTVIASAGTGVLVGSRLAGLYDNPNSLGILAAFTTAIGLGLYMSGPPIRRAPIVVAIGFAVFALAATQSRTAIVGLVLGVFLMLVRVRRVPPMLTLTACLILAGVVVFVGLGGRVTLPSVADRFDTGSDGFFAERELIWDYSIRLWELEPLTGYGFRTGEIVSAQMASISGGAAIGAAFNSYLQILLELGLLGMVPLALLLLALFWAIIRARVVSIFGGLGVLVVAGMTSGITESALFGLGSPIAWVFWFGATAIAVGVAPSARLHAVQSSRPRRIMRV